jgi:hypothetical protein
LQISLSFTQDEALLECVEVAISAVYYGHDYRQKYEKQLTEKGEIKEAYALPDPTIILSFLAVAALSVIVGNLSYDIAKKAFLAIWRKAVKSQDDIGQHKINFTNETEINIFIGQIKEFHLNFPNINPLVKSEIEKEMLTWELSNAVKSEITNDKFTKDDVFNAVKRGFENAEHPQKLSEKDFNEFWKAIKK